MPVPSVRFIDGDTSSTANYSQPRRVFYAGYFDKGSPDTLTPVYSILDFKTKFGKPNKNNMNDWFQIYNYFLYDNNEIVISRSIGENSVNASISYPFNDFDVRIDNLDDFRNKPVISENNFLRIIARNPGEWGNDLTVCIFTQYEVLNNMLIHSNYLAKDIQNSMGSNQYCICVFLKDTLMEKYILKESENMVDTINENSNYIFIVFDPKKYKLYDGNIHYVDGLNRLADGNEPNLDKVTFYGSNSLKLSNGYASLPSTTQIDETYKSVGESNDYVFDFIIANAQSPNSAINLADTRGDCCAFIGIPRGIKPEEYIKQLQISNNAIVYYGSKLQLNPFNNQNIYVSCIGDIVGLRTRLINSQELSVSHCKTIYSFLNTIDLDIYLTESQIKDLYDLNINIVKKGYSGIYALSENTLKGSKLTNRIIYFNLVRECENVALYYVFENNDEYTRNDLASKIKEICRRYIADNNIEDFKIVCDISNNPTQDNNIYVDVYYKPKYLIEEIVFRIQAANELPV
ncbi:hypothetical protein ACEB11_001647 [Campylobacter coli]